MKKNGEIEDKSWGNEERGEFGSLWSESLRFKCGTPITPSLSSF
jgi:hypothetical protein